ncbi:MAG: hypothetical protein HY290_25820 [Planctomycetia bacterium]|nr:hypothetical protein [Planctomycetia bacterium]
MVPELGVRAIVVVITILGMPVVTSADGLFQQIPADGTWVRFDAEWATLGADEQIKSRTTGRVTISSTGKESRDDEDCRWIEIKTVRKLDDGTNGIDFFKMLIPERRMRTGEKPLDHVLKAWHKVGGFRHPQTGEVMEWDRQKADLRSVNTLSQNQDLRIYLDGPLPNAQKLAAVTIDSKIGPVRCDGIAGTFVGKTQSGAQTELYQEYRLHEKAPFGVVSYRGTFTRKVNGVTAPDHIRVIFTLADFGDRAKTELPQD